MTPGTPDTRPGVFMIDPLPTQPPLAGVWGCILLLSLFSSLLLFFSSPDESGFHPDEVAFHPDETAFHPDRAVFSSLSCVPRIDAHRLAHRCALPRALLRALVRIALAKTLAAQLRDPKPKE